MEKKVEEFERRCPSLGGPVLFSYCMVCGEDALPCWKIIHCWWELFDVQDHLKKKLPEEKFKQLVQKKPKPKLTTILELVEQAKPKNKER